MSGDFAALAEIAARMKLQALSEFAQLRRREAALSAEIAKLAATLERETVAVQPGELTAALALQRFASVAAQRSDRLLAKKRALTPELEEARKRAMRENGKVEAIEILASRERAEARQRNLRREENMAPTAIRAFRVSPLASSKR